MNWHRASFEMKDGNVRAHGMDDRDDVHVDGDSHLSLFLPPHKSKLLYPWVCLEFRWTYSLRNSPSNISDVFTQVVGDFH